MRNLICFFTACLLLSNFFAQTELEDIFDDKTRTTSTYIGSNIIATIAGVPNVEIDVRIKEYKWLAIGSLGVLPFGYRLSPEGWDRVVFVNGIGSLFNAGLGYQFYKGGNWNEGGVYLGPKIEFISHQFSTLSSIRRYSNYGMPNSNPTYEVGENGKFVVNRLDQNYGMFVHFLTVLKKRWSVIAGFSCGYHFSKIRYNSKNSVNITWNSPVPSGWGSAKRDIYLRYNLSFRYRLF